MKSQSLVQFASGLASGRRIQEAAGDPRLRPIPHEKKRGFLHASLAAYVASWDSYLNNVVREFCAGIRKPLDPEYSQVHGSLEVFVERSLKRFNTPNSNNSRVLLVDCTGYDPINDWKWPKAGLNATEARDFLDQILKVRHSFAHGFAIPSYDWTTTPSGDRRLDARSLKRIDAFLMHLAKATDMGLAEYARGVYPSAGIWT
ncbi:hypothetical protein [Pelagibius sp. 7325]|uniref:hypothetical protein n=1 Tax=Pelagibius sp. 7325 TaxID=3131994 RepID=UPI0030EDC184